ncbi:Fumarylpyruvate hydrolase [Paraburkholderia piptadeniae]|uniref:Fumarylpyruvate hydrolase n=1 Tax=Paraburkholderia piptadeniae TaxID=1701573 RepID=A0A1N7SPI9_9BURK|nr:fumarylacetoacetate hydrolase family protein [Paraburkholderia piptadeniae]SIT49298.1 Fumarylpyruvate hydrolase [Paraburkholderia piptadeniae]
MSYAIAVPEVATVEVQGGDPFPVRRIYCVGRNYAAHAREMGHDPTREPPFFFMKPGDAVVPSGTAVKYPSKTAEYHHEIELVVALKSGGTDIPVERALDCVFGYAVGLDMTRRDLQSEAKKMGRPWDLSKGFDESAPISAIVPAEKSGHFDSGAIWLKVNGNVRQKGDLSDLIWDIAETISFLSAYVELAAGDLIFTGTPDGVGAVVKGDELVGHVDGLPELRINIE